MKLHLKIELDPRALRILVHAAIVVLWMFAN